MPATLAALPDARLDILRHAARWVAARFADEQARRAQMGFNDLLTRLDTKQAQIGILGLDEQVPFLLL